MQIEKLTEGRRVGYRSKANAGKATVLGTHVGKTGAWVTLHDKDRRVMVVVRPSQVTPR